MAGEKLDHGCMSESDAFLRSGTSGTGRDSHADLSSRHLYPNKPAIHRVLLEGAHEEPELIPYNVPDLSVKPAEIDQN